MQECKINPKALLGQCPQAQALIHGSAKYPDIRGNVMFYQTDYGVLVAAEVMGLPYRMNQRDRPVFGFHIHEGECCLGNAEDPFAEAGQHYNPERYPHPYHAGDLPPLLGNSGYALQVFLTDRFCVREILGRTMIIHSMSDDFTSQPSGNAGEKIACGVVKSCCNC